MKWPNDLLVGDRKLAGVLAEVDGDGAVVVGIGINVNWRGRPAGQRRRRQPGRRARRSTATRCSAASWPVSTSATAGWDDVAAEYRQRCATLGRTVRVELSDETFTGVAADVNDDGHLLVDVGDVPVPRP